MTFLYTVNPRIPIRNLIPGKLINRETNLKLDLDQVKVCLKHGPVYRKFSVGESIRVTLDNCERLHQSEYVSEIDADSKFIPTEENVEKPAEEKKEFVEPKVEELSEQQIEEKIEEIAEENHTDVVEGDASVETLESAEEVLEQADEAIEQVMGNAESIGVDTVEEATVEGAPEKVEDEVQSSQSNNNQKNNKNYNGNKPRKYVKNNH